MRLLLLVFVAFLAFGCVSSPPSGSFKNAGDTCVSSNECTPGAWCEGYATTVSGTITPGVCTQFFDWRPYGVMAVLISLAFTAIAYMLSKVLNNPQLNAWAKTEMIQAIASIFFLGMLIAFVASTNLLLNTVVGDSCSSKQECHMEIARKYLENTIVGVRQSASGLLQLNSLMMLFTSVSINFESNPKPYSGLSILPMSFLSIISDTISTCFDVLMKVLIVLYFQKFALVYIQQAIFPLFLTLGVVLRTFFFTRKLGGLLIAIAVGIYVILPLMYSFAFAIVYPTPESRYQIDVNLGNVTDSNSVMGYYESIRPKLDTASQGGYSVNLPTTIDFNSIYVQNPDNTSFLDWLIGDNGVIERVARLLVLSTFVPYFALITTISFIKIFSPFIGGDVEIAGLTHLI